MAQPISLLTLNISSLGNAFSSKSLICFDLENIKVDVAGTTELEKVCPKRKPFMLQCEQ